MYVTLDLLSSAITQEVLFYLFSGLALLSAGAVIFARSPVDSVLFLILVFANATGLLILIGVEFLAMIFLVVYVGAIAVLFLFIVMMLNTKLKTQSVATNARYLPTGALIASIFLISMFLLVDYNFRSIALIDNMNVMMNAPEANILTTILPIIIAAAKGNIEVIGDVLYTIYAYPFILSGVILLLAMIGAIVLTLHRRSEDVKRQVVAEQVYRDSNRIIKFSSNKANTKENRGIINAVNGNTANATTADVAPPPSPPVPVQAPVQAPAPAQAPAQAPGNIGASGVSGASGIHGASGSSGSSRKSGNSP